MESGSLGYFIFIYEKFATAENQSSRHIGSVVFAVTKFDNFLGGVTDINTVEDEDLRRYIRHLQQELKWSCHPTINPTHGILTDNSIASYVRNIKSFWAWLKREDFISNNPLQRVKTPDTTERIVDPLSPETVTRLLKVIPRNEYKGNRDSCIITTLYGTGQRISELLYLPKDNINFDTGQITVIGKGKKERSLFMSPSVFKALYKYSVKYRPDIPSSYFFIHEDGRPITRFNFEHRMQTYVKRAGITTACTPHILRYSFAIQFLRNGGDPFTLQQILGHSTMEMTRRYLKIASSDVEVKMKQFSPAEQLGIRF